jgi:thioredoxin 1
MDRKGSVLNVNDGDFSKEVLESKTPVLLAFWAHGCEPCQTMAPVIEALAREYDGKIKVARMRVEENPRTPGGYGVRGIPTFLIFEHGAVSDRIVGIVSRKRLRQMVERVVGK